jgi:hypothetical protein
VVQDIETSNSIEAVSKTKSTEENIKHYSSFSTWEKRFIVFTATIAAVFSQFTAQIYFPALNNIAKDLHATNSKVNLTITTYMFCALSYLDPRIIDILREEIQSSCNVPVLLVLDHGASWFVLGKAGTLSMIKSNTVGCY